MNVSPTTKHSRLSPSVLRGRCITRLAQFGAAISLALFTLTASSSAQEPKTAPVRDAMSSDWLRMREGLKKARPMPEPENRLRSAATTSSGKLVRFDALTGKVSTLTPAKFDAKSLAVNQQEGHPADAPIPASGGPQFIIENSIPEQFGVTGATKNDIIRQSITATPPEPVPQPYNLQPFASEFRLLMRFAVPDFGDMFYLCSASSASDFHLISAGHCVYNHDPLGDKSGRGAGFAAEMWAWPAETDVVDPVYATNGLPDFPWGVAKMTFQTTYSSWIDNSDFNHDLSFIALDRRIGDHVGWAAREWGVNATSLLYTGYPAEAPYVPSYNPFQYAGGDVGNVDGYTCCRIQMEALTYGGHSGGGVFRFSQNNGFNLWVFEGVNSTSTRVGYAEATLFTAQSNADLVNAINTDLSVRPPVDRAQLIEYVFDNDSKGLFATSVAAGDPFSFRINAFNAGYTSAGTVTADIYLTDRPDVLSGTYIGSIVLGNLDANQFLKYNTALTLPTYVKPGNYFLGWALRGTNPQYDTDNHTAIITKDLLRVVGLSSVVTNPITVIGGSSTTGIVELTSPAPPNGLGHGIDVLLSSSNAAAQFTNFVHVNEGATSATFNITTSPVKQNTTVIITANLHGITRTTSLLIKPVALGSLALAPSSVVGSNSSTATVRLTGSAPAGGITVNLSSSNAKAVVPASVHVNAGSASATFTVKTSAVAAPTTASIQATFSGISQAAPLSINPPTPNSLGLAPSSVVGSNSSTATVGLTGPAPAGGITVNLSSSNAKAVVPASVHVNAGSASATFTVKTSAVTAPTTASIQATFSGVSKAATLSISQPTPNSLGLAPSSVVGSNSSTATVGLTGPAPAGGITVNLSSSNAKAVVPASVHVNAGSASATFTVKTSSVTAPTTASIQATFSGISKAATLSINPVQPTAITLSPSTLKGGAHSVATITINGPAPAAGATISLTSSNAHATLPKTVLVSAGHSSITVTVNTTAVTANTAASIKATSFGVSKSANLTIQP